VGAGTLGPWVYPLGAIAVVLFADAVRAGVALAARDGAAMRASPHHTVLGWGVLAAVVGLLGTTIGFGRLLTGARVAAGGDRAELEGVLEVLQAGAIVSVAPAVVGLGLFTAAVCAWLALQYLALWGDR
jgi:hypothetical protein